MKTDPNPHNEPAAPPGHELLTAEFLREHGAVEGMKTGRKHPPHFWEPTGGKPPTEQWEFENFAFIAPIGSIAATLTPAPTGFRNVLSGWLAEQKEKPKDLMWGNAHPWPSTNTNWKPMSDRTWKNKKDFLDDPAFAYAIPISNVSSTQTRKEYAITSTTSDRREEGTGNEASPTGLIREPQCAVSETPTGGARQDEKASGRDDGIRQDSVGTDCRVPGVATAAPAEVPSSAGSGQEPPLNLHRALVDIVLEASDADIEQMNCPTCQGGEVEGPCPTCGCTGEVPARPLHPTPEAGETRETPETDGQIVYWKRKMYQPSEAVVPADFARRLERERNEARDTKDVLWGQLQESRKQLQTATEVVNTLQGICEGYEQRLKVSEPALTASRAEADAAKAKAKETAKDFETAFRVVREENDKLRAEEEGLRRERDDATKSMWSFKNAMDKAANERDDLRAQLTTERALREAAEREARITVACPGHKETARELDNTCPICLLRDLNVALAKLKTQS